MRVNKKQKEILKRLKSRVVTPESIENKKLTCEELRAILQDYKAVIFGSEPVDDKVFSKNLRTLIKLIVKQ